MRVQPNRGILLTSNYDPQSFEIGHDKIGVQQLHMALNYLLLYPGVRYRLP